MKTLEQYFRDAAAVGAIDFALRATVVDGERVTFYLHPHGQDGETLDFTVTGNVLTPPGEFPPLVGPKPDASVTIERHGDRYCASTGADENGMAMGIAANLDHTAAQSLSSALDFARERLTADLNERLGMTFGEAIVALKAGNRVARAGWNGKGMWLVYMSGMSLPPYSTQGSDRKVNDRTARWIGEDTPLDTLPYIAMWTADKKWLPGWLASQTDVLAEDWIVVDVAG